MIRFASIASAQDDPDTKHDIVRAGQRSYEVLQYSPDHHYAVVWGMSKRQVDFAHFDADAIDSGDIVNCIVDCLSHELVAILAGFEHFPSRNHSSLEITWEKHGRHAFVIWQSKWNPEGYALVDLVGSHRGRQTDLAGFESALQERVRLATGDLPAVPYPALECTGTFAANGDLEINGHVYPGKWPNGWFYDCTLIYSLDNYGTFTSIQPRPVGMVRARRSVLTSGDSGETYPRSDAVAVYSANNRLRNRMKIEYAIITGSDKLYQRSMTVERFGDNGKRS